MNKKELRENIAMASRMLKPALEATSSPDFKAGRKGAMNRRDVLEKYFRVMNALLTLAEREA